MSYLSTVFPTNISFGAVGGPGWATTVVITAGGYRYGNQANDQALCRYDVSHAARDPTTFASLLTFFRAARGPMHSFPFKDWTDYQCLDAVGRFVLVGTNSYQLIKNYAAGGVTHARTILRPVSTITVVGGTAVSVDYATGLVSSTSAPTSWSGEFYVPAHFEVEDFRGEILDGVTANRTMGWSGIMIVETRNP
jgi:uncharacterized protein (TIGR02217 family)